MLMSLIEAFIFIFPCLCRWQKRLFSFFRAYVVDRSAYFLFFVLMSLTEALIFIFPCLCRWQKCLFSFFRAYVVDRSDYFLFFMLMSLTEAIIFSFSCLCRWQKQLFSLFRAYVVDRSNYFHFFQGLEFSLFLILYPVRNSLPFTSFRPVTVGSGRDFLESDTYKGQAHGLLECRLDPHPPVAEVAVHTHATTVELYAVRVLITIVWVRTRRPIEAGFANLVQTTKEVATQGRQVEIFACVSGGRKGTRWVPEFGLHCCSPITAVDSGVAVVMTFGLQYWLLLKPHATFI